MFSSPKAIDQDEFYKFVNRDDFPIVCVSMVRGDQGEETLDDYFLRILDEIKCWPKGTKVGIWPEYTFRHAELDPVINGIKKHLLNIPGYEDTTLVLGTLEFELNGELTNNAIILHHNELIFRSKVQVLEGELRQGIKPGKRIDAIQLPDFTLGVIVCADIWNPAILSELAAKQEIDILAIPAWTATYEPDQAKRLWHHAISTECVRYGITIAVSDHLQAPKDSKYGVANATLIKSPDKRWFKESLAHKVYRQISFVNLEAVRKAREAWFSKGMKPRSINEVNETDEEKKLRSLQL